MFSRPVSPRARPTLANRSGSKVAERAAAAGPGGATRAARPTTPHRGTGTRQDETCMRWACIRAATIAGCLKTRMAASSQLLEMITGECRVPAAPRCSGRCRRSRRPIRAWRPGDGPGSGTTEVRHAEDQHRTQPLRTRGANPLDQFRGRHGRHPGPGRKSGSPRHDQGHGHGHDRGRRRAGSPAPGPGIAGATYYRHPGRQDQPSPGPLAGQDSSPHRPAAPDGGRGHPRHGQKCAWASQTSATWQPAISAPDGQRKS